MNPADMPYTHKMPYSNMPERPENTQFRDGFGRRRVVVTRMGVVSPLGNSIAEFERRLFNAECGLSYLTRFDEPEFSWFKLDPEYKQGIFPNVVGQVEQPEISDIVPKVRSRISRFTMYGIAAVRQMVYGNLILRSDDPYKAGILIATGGGGQEESEHQQINLLSSNKPKISPLTIPLRMPNSCSGKLAEILSWVSAKEGEKNEECMKFEWDTNEVDKSKKMKEAIWKSDVNEQLQMLSDPEAFKFSNDKFKFCGENHAPSTACASAGTAIGYLFRLIQHGYLDFGFAGGSEASLTPETITGFHIMGALSKSRDPSDASKPFDLHRDGFVISEGAGALFLESLEHAVARDGEAEILAEIVGYGASDDAFHTTHPHYLADGAHMAMKLAIKDAGIEPKEIGYINAHGTSTELNDLMETFAIKRLFWDYYKALKDIPPVSSSKSQFGHGIGAAAAFESIACILALKNGLLPPTINYKTPDPRCDLDYVPNEARPVKNLIYVMNNSFGFGGPNAVLIFRKFFKE